jgi:hypothetical protein
MCQWHFTLQCHITMIGLSQQRVTRVMSKFESKEHTFYRLLHVEPGWLVITSVGRQTHTKQNISQRPFEQNRNPFWPPKARREREDQVFIVIVIG